MLAVHFVVLLVSHPSSASSYLSESWVSWCLLGWSSRSSWAFWPYSSWFHGIRPHAAWTCACFCLLPLGQCWAWRWACWCWGGSSSPDVFSVSGVAVVTACPSSAAAFFLSVCAREELHKSSSSSCSHVVHRIPFFSPYSLFPSWSSRCEEEEDILLQNQKSESDLLPRRILHQSVKKSVSRMGEVGHNPACRPQSPGAVQVLRMEGCSQSASQHSVWYAAVCSCPQQWQQRTRRWWRRWGWTPWWQRRSAPSSSLAGWTSSAAAGRTSSVALSWWGIWCSAPRLGPGWWWCPGLLQSKINPRVLVRCPVVFTGRQLSPAELSLAAPSDPGHKPGDSSRSSRAT